MALDDAAETILDEAVTVSPLDNDTSVVDGALSIAIVTGPTHGTATINDDSTITYTPEDGYYGADSFVYQITDAASNTATATVSINVFQLQAVGDTASAAMNTPPTIAVLNNDIGAVSIVSVTDASNGTVSLDGNNIIYTPNADFTGPDLIGYTIADSLGHTSSTTVDISVYDPAAPTPTISASDYSVTTATGTPITVDVLDEDSNYVGNPIIATAPLNGVVAVQQDGTIVYTPNAGFTGSDSFQYTIADANGNTATGTVNVSVQPVVVQFDINDTAEQSDDLAFLNKPIAVRVTLESPGLSGSQSVTIDLLKPVAGGPDTATDRGVIVLDPSDAASLGSTETTLQLTSGQSTEIWIIPTNVSQSADDLHLAAYFAANNVGWGKLGAIDVSLGSGALNATGGFVYHYGPGGAPADGGGAIYADSTPQSMVNNSQFRIAPRTWTLVWVAERGDMSDKRIYLKVFNKNDNNGRVEISRNLFQRLDNWGNDNVLVLKGSDFTHNDPFGDNTVKVAYTRVRGAVEGGFEHGNSSLSDALIPGRLVDSGPKI